MSKIFPSLKEELRVIIIGASGGIGGALVKELNQSAQVKEIYALSRSAAPNFGSKVKSIAFDFTDEGRIETVANDLKATGQFDVIIIATGLLSNENLAPEKSLRSLSSDAINQSMAINAIGPTLCAKHMLKLFDRNNRTLFGILSARVGSIEDNRLGGWYSYRASKAALNMLIKTASIEHKIRYPHSVIALLHPGTVDTQLSKPFQRNVPDGKLFTAEYSASKLIEVLDGLAPDQSGKLFAWDGKEIPY